MIVIIRNLGQSQGKSFHTNKKTNQKILTLKINSKTIKTIKQTLGGIIK